MSDTDDKPSKHTNQVLIIYLFECECGMRMNDYERTRRSRTEDASERDDESTNERNNHGGAVATNDRPAQDTLILYSRTDAR